VLNPPPLSIQPISRTPGLFWQVVGGSAESTLVPVTGSVHRYVPPTAVTRGSEAGHPTVGNGKSLAPLGLPNESMIATVTLWPWLPAAYSGERLYEFSIEAGLKQRRAAGTALAQSAWVGGVMLPLSHCASLKVGSGVGSAIAAVCPVAPDGARASAATARTAADGRRLDRHGAARIVRRVTRRAGIAGHVSPHTLRYAFITAALDAGIPLRDVQEAAPHADLRTTMPYDRARTSLDRHATSSPLLHRRSSEEGRDCNRCPARRGCCARAVTSPPERSWRG
jgi:hypothetical protein